MHTILFDHDTCIYTLIYQSQKYSYTVDLSSRYLEYQSQKSWKRRKNQEIGLGK